MIIFFFGGSEGLITEHPTDSINNWADAISRFPYYVVGIYIKLTKILS